MGRITSSKKQLKPDPRYGSILAGKFVNCLMLDGKKTVAQTVFYDALNRRVPGDFRATVNSLVSLGVRGIFIVTGLLPHAVQRTASLVAH